MVLQIKLFSTKLQAKKQRTEADKSTPAQTVIGMKINKTEALLIRFYETSGLNHIIFLCPQDVQSGR